MEARRAAEAVARDSYGRLVAYLASRSRDVAAAEDALGEAFLAALETWPRDGVPGRPEAWMLTVARRRLIDGARRARVRSEAASTLRLASLAAEGPADASPFPDERLKLLFACAHPAIDIGARTALMLQAVLGLDAARIASAFLVAPATLGQRLVRAKAKIRDAGIPLEVPEPDELPGRLGPVLEAIYAAYGTAWDDLAGADPRRKGLAEEATRLARLVVQLLPDEPEARGLLALVIHCEARREARRAPEGRYVPLSEQDVSLWSRPMIEEAERELAEAATRGRIGRFQLEAAIQSVHAQRAATSVTAWGEVALLYEELTRLAPTPGSLVGRAAALANVQGPAAGLAALDAFAPGSVASYQPYWAVRAHLLAELGSREEACRAYRRAIGLSGDEPVRDFLEERSRSLA